jgi:hypothetical protein
VLKCISILFMYHSCTRKDRDVVGFFLRNGNKPAYQKQIAEGAKVSERHLGDLHNKPGRLSILVKGDILKKELKFVQNRGQTFHYFLSEDLKGYQKVGRCWLCLTKFGTGKAEITVEDLDIWRSSEYKKRMKEKLCKKAHDETLATRKTKNKLLVVFWDCRFLQRLKGGNRFFLSVCLAFSKAFLIFI